MEPGTSAFTGDVGAESESAPSRYILVESGRREGCHSVSVGDTVMVLER